MRVIPRMETWDSVNSGMARKFQIENCGIVEFRIPGYPGPSKERSTEVRLMQGKIFRGKIRMYLLLYVVYNYCF